MGELRIMSAKKCLSILDEDLQKDLFKMGVNPEAGDTKVIWNPRDEDEVSAAKRTWKELVTKKGFRGFKVTGKGNKGEQISEFDPEAAKLIIAPPMAGGS